MNDLTSVAFITAVATGAVSAVTSFIATWRLRREAKERSDVATNVDAKLTRASLASTTDVKMEVGGKEVDLTGALTDEELASLIEKALGDGPESEPE
jgi:osmotically-inducible protein OsmY